MKNNWLLKCVLIVVFISLGDVMMISYSDKLELMHYCFISCLRVVLSACLFSLIHVVPHLVGVHGIKL
jgi:hypothetical protein